MLQTKAKVSLKQIAQELGVHHSTVSRVRNQSKSFSVSDEMRKKIIQACEKHNYTPRTSACSLRSGKVFSLGLILGAESYDWGDLHSGYLISGFMDRAAELGYNTSVFSLKQIGGLSEKMRNVILGGGVDGYAVGCGILDPESSALLVRNGIPSVEFDFRADSSLASSVCVRTDCTDAFRELFRRFTDNGVKRIGMLCNEKELRYKTFIKTTAEFELDFKESRDVIYVDCDCAVNERLMAAEIVRRNIEKIKKIGAFFCSSDLLAMGMMDALETFGISAGKDIIVAGYNNTECNPAYKPLRIPYVTTIDPHYGKWGGIAAEELIRQIDGENDVRRVVLVKSELIWRS